MEMEPEGLAGDHTACMAQVDPEWAEGCVTKKESQAKMKELRMKRGFFKRTIGGAFAPASSSTTRSQPPSSSRGHVAMKGSILRGGSGKITSLTDGEAGAGAFSHWQRFLGRVSLEEVAPEDATTVAGPDIRRATRSARCTGHSGSSATLRR